MTREFTPEDEGKPVETADGLRVGTVHRVGETIAHVRPEPGLGEEVRDRLGWTAAETQVYELTVGAVESVTEERVQLEADL